MAPVVRNPDFDPGPERIAAERRLLARDASPLARPVVILAGWRAPHVNAWALRRLLLPLTGGNAAAFTLVSYFWHGSFAGAVRHAWRRLDRRGLLAPGVEVDVIGISMGGLVARALAAGLERRPALAIRTLFTLSTPHAGARLADTIAPDSAARDLRAGSRLLGILDEHLPGASYDLRCYCLLRDWWVGARRAAPPGRHPFWLDGLTPASRALSHFLVSNDPRIVVDIARRLRGLAPLARAATPPPRD